MKLGKYTIGVAGVRRAGIKYIDCLDSKYWIVTSWRNLAASFYWQVPIIEGPWLKKAGNALGRARLWTLFKDSRQRFGFMQVISFLETLLLIWKVKSLILPRLRKRYIPSLLPFSFLNIQVIFYLPFKKESKIKDCSWGFTCMCKITWY